VNACRLPELRRRAGERRWRDRGRNSGEANTHLQRHLETRTNQQQLGQDDRTNGACYGQTNAQHPQNIGSLRARGNSEGGRHDDDGENGASVDGEQDVGALRVERKEGGLEGRNEDIQ
jgi:hypothetical protein